MAHFPCKMLNKHKIRTSVLCNSTNCPMLLTCEIEYEVIDIAQQYVEKVGILTGSSLTDTNLHVV